MAQWYETEFIGGPSLRADCVAQIVTDINAYITVDADGQTTFNIAQFMIAAAPRLAAIPDPGFHFA
jgi:hypothetical protein